MIFNINFEEILSIAIIILKWCGILFGILVGLGFLFMFLLIIKYVREIHDIDNNETNEDSFYNTIDDKVNEDK